MTFLFTIGVRLVGTLTVACSICAVHASVSSATDIRAEVKPVRIIYADTHDAIVRVTSNTPNTITPVVRRTGSENTIPLTSSIRSQYEQVLRSHDMSRPVDIWVSDSTAWQSVLNYLANVFVRLFKV